MFSSRKQRNHCRKRDNEEEVVNGIIVALTELSVDDRKRVIASFDADGNYESDFLSPEPVVDGCYPTPTPRPRPRPRFIPNPPNTHPTPQIRGATTGVGSTSLRENLGFAVTVDA